MANWITHTEYETWRGITLKSEVADYVDNQLIPAMQRKIVLDIGYDFKVAVGTNQKYDAVEDTFGELLYFRTWAAEAPSTIKLNGVTIPTADYVMEGDRLNAGPYWGVRLLASSGQSWGNYGEEPKDAIEVSAKWGYSADLPPDIEEALMLLIDQRLANRGGTARQKMSPDYFRAIENYPKFRIFG